MDMRGIMIGVMMAWVMATGFAAGITERFSERVYEEGRIENAKVVRKGWRAEIEWADEKAGMIKREAKSLRIWNEATGEEYVSVKDVRLDYWDSGEFVFDVKNKKGERVTFGVDKDCVYPIQSNYIGDVRMEREAGERTYNAKIGEGAGIVEYVEAVYESVLKGDKKYEYECKAMEVILGKRKWKEKVVDRKNGYVFACDGDKDDDTYYQFESCYFRMKDGRVLVAMWWIYRAGEEERTFRMYAADKAKGTIKEVQNTLYVDGKARRGYKLPRYGKKVEYEEGGKKRAWEFDGEKFVVRN